MFLGFQSQREECCLNNPRIHKRVNNILLGPLERPALKWLAAHSPSWMTPDFFTAVGILGAAAFIGYLLSRYNRLFFWMATFGFMVNWYGDSMDGTLARYRQIERPNYGYFVDHITDAMGQVFIFVGLGISPYVTFNMAILALVAFLVLSIMVYLRTYVEGEFKLSYAMLAPTEARALAYCLNRHVLFWKAIMAYQNTLLGHPVLTPTICLLARLPC